MMQRCRETLPPSLQQELEASVFDWSMSAEDLEMQERYLELLPSSLRRHIETSPRFREGLLSPADFALMSLGLPPRADRPHGVVDWLWYHETFRGFPMKWRRAFGEDPPVYDATMLLRVLVDSLQCGEACCSEERPTQRDFATLLKYGTPAWQRRVLREARWMPRNGALLVTEPGMEVLTQVAPLALRRTLGMAGPGDTDDEDLLVCRSFEGRKMWILRGYDESEQCHFALIEVARALGLSQKNLRKFRRDHPEMVTEGMSPPPGFFDGEKKPKGEPTKEESATAEPEKPEPKEQQPEPKEQQPEPNEKKPEPNEKKPEPKEERFASAPSVSELEEQRLRAAIREANATARRERLERRGKAGMTSLAFLGAEPVRVDAAPPPPSPSSAQSPPQRRRRPRRKADPKAAERTAAFLRECQPAIEAAKVVDEVVREDVLPEIERRLRRGLLAARRHEKRSARVAADAAGRRRVQELLLG